MTLLIIYLPFLKINFDKRVIYSKLWTTGLPAEAIYMYHYLNQQKYKFVHVQHPYIYNRQSCLTRWKAHIFSLKLTHLIPTKDTFLCPKTGGHQLSYIINPTLRHWLSTNHLLYLSHKNYVLRVDTVPCSNNERFQQVITMILLNSNPPWREQFLIT